MNEKAVTIKRFVVSVLIAFLLGVIVGTGATIALFNRSDENRERSDQEAVEDYLKRKRSVEDLYRRGETRERRMDEAVHGIERGASSIGESSDRIDSYLNEMEEILNNSNTE